MIDGPEKFLTVREIIGRRTNLEVPIRDRLAIAGAEGLGLLLATSADLSKTFSERPDLALVPALLALWFSVGSQVGAIRYYISGEQNGKN
jgi:hypothetical protein